MGIILSGQYGKPQIRSHRPVPGHKCARRVEDNQFVDAIPASAFEYSDTLVIPQFERRANIHFPKPGRGDSILKLFAGEGSGKSLDLTPRPGEHPKTDPSADPVALQIDDHIVTPDNQPWQQKIAVEKLPFGSGPAQRQDLIK